MKNIPTLTIALSAIVIFATILEASDSSTVNYATNQNITAFTTCKKVTNGSLTGKNVYVPTQSSAEWASFYSNPPTGVTAGPCTCALPWGGTINEGESVTAYSASSVACGSSCTAVAQTRTCTNGMLSGTNSNPSCSVAACPSYSWQSAGTGSCSSVPSFCPHTVEGQSCSSPGSLCKQVMMGNTCYIFRCQ